MNHFINIKEISASKLRKIINNAKKRKLKRLKLNILDRDKDAPLNGKLVIKMFERSYIFNFSNKFINIIKELVLDNQKIM